MISGTSSSSSSSEGNKKDDDDDDAQERKPTFPSRALGPKMILKRRPEGLKASSQATRDDTRGKPDEEEKSMPSLSASIVDEEEGASAMPPSSQPPSTSTRVPPTLHREARTSEVFRIAEVTYPAISSRHGKGSGTFRRGESSSVEFKFTSPIEKSLTKNRNFLVVTALSLHCGAGKSTILKHLSGPTNTRMPPYEYSHGRARSTNGKSSGVDAWLTLDRIIVLDPIGVNLLAMEKKDLSNNGAGRDRRNASDREKDAGQNTIIKWLLNVVDVVIAVVCSSKELDKVEEIISANSDGHKPMILPVLNLAIPQTHETAAFQGPCVPYITPEDEKMEMGNDNGRRLISYPGLNDVLHTTPLSLDVSLMLRGAVREKASGGSSNRHGTEIEWWTSTLVKWRELQARQAASSDPSVNNVDSGGDDIRSHLNAVPTG